MLKELHNKVAALKVKLQFDEIPQDMQQIHQNRNLINQYKKQISDLEKILMSEGDYSHNSSDIQKINIIKTEIQAIEPLLNRYQQEIQEKYSNSNTVDLIPADDQIEGLEEEEIDEGKCPSCQGKCYLIFQISIFFIVVITIVILSLVFADAPSGTSNNNQNTNVSNATETPSAAEFTEIPKESNDNSHILMNSENVNIQDNIYHT